MNMPRLPSPATSANSLHLYDFTHGQRRLAVWQEYGHNGRLAMHATLAVPVTQQAPGEAPAVDWVTIVAARSFRPQLVRYGPDSTNVMAFSADGQLVLDGTEFALLESEAEDIAECFNLDAGVQS